MSYTPHRAYCAPALPSAGMPLLVIGVIAVEAINSGLRWVFDRALDATPGLSAQMVWYGSTPGGLLLQLFSFGFLVLGVAVVTLRGHHRGLGSLIGPPALAAQHLARVLIAVLILFALIEMLSPGANSAAEADLRSPRLWLVLLVPSLLALLVQTGAEELFYRGYIQQQIAARFDRPLVWLLVPNVMFALAHWPTGDFSIPALQYMIWAFCFGLAASDLTARTGSLGAAVGFHMANNAFAFLIFAERQAPDSGLALYLFPQGALSGKLVEGAPFLSAAFLVELSGVALMWLAARVAIRH